MSISPKEIEELGESGLRSFGLSTGGMVALLFGLVLPWLFGFAYPTWPWILCAVLVFSGLVWPRALGPVYRVWMRFGLLMSRITTPLILGIVFFVVLLPMGLFAKLFRPDPLVRKFDKSVDSYRVSGEKPPIKNLENPF
jgi:Kef-type K+ transport system membrane component KefB